MADEEDTLSRRLERAMVAAGYVYNDEASQRKLALRLAGDRKDETKVVDARRKQVARWLKSKPGATIHRSTAETLAEILGTSVDYWPISRGRPSELEGRVAQNTRSIDALREAIALLLGQVVALGGVAPEMPADALPPASRDTEA